MIKRLTVGAIAVLVAACSTTVKQEAAFSGTVAGRSFVVIAAEDLAPGEVHTFELKRVDLVSRTILRESASVRFVTVLESMFGADEFRKPETMTTELRFGGREIAAGDYALVSHTRRSYTGYSTAVYVDCYANGAPIYRFREGAIHVIHVARFVPSWLAPALIQSSPSPPLDYVALQRQVGEVLARYPNMTARRVVAEPVGTVKFESASKNDCIQAGPATFTRAPATNW